MKSLWNDNDAKKYGKSLLAKRVYTSRLLGANPDLVLHGGGNTSVKIKKKDFFGISKEYLYVKGSGCDLATINEDDFSACDMQDLLSLSLMDDLSDTNMVNQSRASMLDPNSLTPSIEAIVHAVIPSKYVDHTHADSILSLTNCPNGRKNISDLFGDSVIVVPYVMPGFDLAKEVRKKIQKAQLSKVKGMILMNHGIFTFDDDPRSSYEKMIRLVSRAERYIKKKISKKKLPSLKSQGISPNDLSRLRKVVSEWRGQPVLASFDNDIKSTYFACLKNIKSISTRGPLTPDHVIRTKRTPAIIGSNIIDSIDKYVDDYTKYFNRHASNDLTMLDPAPRWAIWPNKGIVYFGKNDKEISIIRDIVRHTIKTIQQTELAFGSWKALSASKLFDIEYWELEQAKLKSKDSHGLPHEGKVAIVTGSAAGIGFACAESLSKDGATVIGLDLNPDIISQMNKINGNGVVVNLTNEVKVKTVIDDIVRSFGGIDILVSNAGIFTAGAFIDKMDQVNWEKSMAVNLTSHQMLLKHTIPFLKEGLSSSIVIIGSRNVVAPGAGASSYSCAKAGLTQLCRVAALELAPHGVRCNIIHPDAVFDTKLWTPEALSRSAERYGLTIDEYKTRNLMKTEIKSADVGNMVSVMSGNVFGKTTGSQISLDGGNDRVI
ncbi:MAG: bifunctional aldolase/short-chain dehydrogenase [Verrucomicrobiales bacterium]|nr:MAG: bifunctional aldolase/short-chain dehydrogenase [Verrucomicrobiota bacterium]